MSFLAPLFLLGALAVAVPIVFHLIRRTSREKVPFSSLMFLQPSPPRMTRRSRLEHILLLALRCIVLALLALGFARPFLQQPTAANSGTGAGARLVVLVDASASMRRDGLWNDAKARAESALRKTSPADAVALVVFDRQSRVLVNFEQWTAASPPERATLAARRLNEISPGWGGTHLGNALLNAVELLEEQPAAGGSVPAARRIVLVTDLQAGAHREGLQGFEWPRGIEVALEQVKARRPTNAGLQFIADTEEKERPADEGELRVRVSNAGGSRREQFQVGWTRDGKAFAGPAIDAYVPPGQSRVLNVPRPNTNAPAEALRLTGDDEEFDNVAYFVPPRPEIVKTVYLGREEERDATQPLFFLRRAFQQTQRRDVQLVSGTAAATAIRDARLLIIADTLEGEPLQAARAHLEAGGTALFVMKSAGTAATLAQLAGVGVIPAEETPSDGYALLGQIDFEHPLFSPFADPRFSDFTKIHFWKHRRVDFASLKDARVLARFDKGDAALVQLPAGKGALLVLTTGWHPADSQLALSTKFVPLLYAMLEFAGASSAQSSHLTVGDAPAAGQTNAAVIVRRPDGGELSVPAGARFGETELPGIYSMVSGSVTQRFAVNLDPSESRTEPLPVEELERLKVPLNLRAEEVALAPAAKEHLRAAELEQRQKLWRWLLIAALVVLMMETWIAGRLTRTPAPA